MRPTYFVLALMITGLAPGVSAQAVPRTDTPRAGALRFTFEPVITTWEREFTDGAHEQPVRSLDRRSPDGHRAPDRPGADAVRSPLAERDGATRPATALHSREAGGATIDVAPAARGARHPQLGSGRLCRHRCRPDAPARQTLRRGFHRWLLDAAARSLQLSFSAGLDRCRDALGHASGRERAGCRHGHPPNATRFRDDLRGIRCGRQLLDRADRQRGGWARAGGDGVSDCDADFSLAVLSSSTA